MTSAPPPDIFLRIDDCDLREATSIASSFGYDKFEYIVTPNVDHIIRYYDEATFRELYVDAGFILLDSRVLALVFRLTKGIVARVSPGSDLTAALLRDADADDRIVLIGATAKQADRLRARYGLHGLMHHEPPQRFIQNATAVEDSLRFVEQNSPFRYCFLAVGSPQQEILARELKRRGRARGLALCVGASVDFLTGIERRAPRWMQRIGFEWFFRMLQNPKRLMTRYLLRGPRVFTIVPRMRIEFRPPAGI